MAKTITPSKERSRRPTLIKVSPYFADSEESFVLYHGDSLEILASMPENSADMIFADPPYFLSNGGITCHAGRMVSVNKGKWDKSLGPDHNHAFNRSWLEKCQRVLTKDGTIWVSGTAHIIYSVGFAMQQLGFKVLNDITWYKRNAPPNLSCRYFTHSTETIIWAAKSEKSKHVFNYQEMRKQANGKQMRSLWLWEGEASSDIEQSLGNVWQLGAPKSAEKLHGKHPTQKPLALLERIILASTNEGQLVLDPFNGSGTTGLAAHKLCRRYVGIDAEAEYLKLTKKRFSDLCSLQVAQ